MADDEKFIYDLESRDRSVKQPKMFYSGDAWVGQPYIAILEEDIAIVGDKTNVMTVNPTFGVLLGGRVSLSCMPDQLSFAGGYWRLDPRHLSTLPSTTPTPIPLLVKSTPLLLKAKDDLKGALGFLEAHSDLKV
jgi:hypothetical protein